MQEEPQEPKGVLACLTAGFEVVAHHPILVAVPLLLDLFLWLGPRLSVKPILIRARDLLTTALTAEGTGLEISQIQWVRLWLDQMMEQFNLFAALRPGPVIGVPSLMSSPMLLMEEGGASWPLPYARPEIIVSSALAALGWSLGLAALGLGLTAIYTRAVGIAVIDDLEYPVDGPDGWIAIWQRLLGFVLSLLLFFIPVGGIAALFVGVVGLISGYIAQVLLMTLISFAFFFLFHLLFVVPGIVQLRRQALQAIRESILLTQGNILSVAGLILLILVVSDGLNVVWRLPEPSSWTMAVGIIGHAFVSAALTATLFVFYHERLGLLKMIKNLYQKHQKEIKEIGAQSGTEV